MYVFLQGRSRDVCDEDQLMEGDSSNVFVRRASAFEDSLEEVQHLDNIRWPLEVTFCGEAAIDMGGPRREFFGIFYTSFKENLLCMKGDSADLSDGEVRHYFYAGLIIGM
jgi:hypothetical protein